MKELASSSFCYFYAIVVILFHGMMLFVCFEWLFGLSTIVYIVKLNFMFGMYPVSV